MMLLLTVCVLAVLLSAAVVAAAHFRAQAKTGATIRDDLADTVRRTLDVLHEELSGDLRDKVDGKFDALAKWLRAEFVKARDAAIPPPAAAVIEAPAPAAPTAELAVDNAIVTAANGTNDAAPTLEVALAQIDAEILTQAPTVEVLLAQIDAEILAAQARRKKVEELSQALRDASKP